MAAHLLTKAIADCLSNEDIQIFAGLTFWVTLFVNKAHLGNSLITRNICSSEQLDGFLSVSAIEWSLSFILSMWRRVSLKPRPVFKSLTSTTARAALMLK